MVGGVGKKKRASFFEGRTVGVLIFGLEDRFWPRWLGSFM
jgi:hypothetical protein